MSKYSVMNFWVCVVCGEVVYSAPVLCPWCGAVEGFVEERVRISIIPIVDKEKRGPV